jgi:hypothetical protein
MYSVSVRKGELTAQSVACGEAFTVSAPVAAVLELTDAADQVTGAYLFEVFTPQSLTRA